jgi:hypothetical protein
VIDSDQPGGGRSRTVALNVTVVKAAAKGLLTVHESGAAPSITSNVNFQEFFAAPNLVITTTDDDGYVCTTANRSDHVIVDRPAVFRPDTTVEATEPERLIGTRCGAAPSDGQIIKINLPDNEDIDIG